VRHAERAAVHPGAPGQREAIAVRGGVELDRIAERRAGDALELIEGPRARIDRDDEAAFHDGQARALTARRDRDRDVDAPGP